MITYLLRIEIFATINHKDAKKYKEGLFSFCSFLVWRNATPLDQT